MHSKKKRLEEKKKEKGYKNVFMTIFRIVELWVMSFKFPFSIYPII